jgi:hypothetical protein
VSTYIADLNATTYGAGTDEIGTFASAPTAGLALAAQPVFTPFGGEVDSYSAGAVGGGTGSASAQAATGVHAQLYLVAFGADGSEFIGDVSDASNSAWQEPATADIPPNTGFDLDSFFASPGAENVTLAPGAQVIYGSVGLDGSGPYQNLLTAAIVPEPSSIALVVMGLLGGIGMIRRRRS